MPGPGGWELQCQYTGRWSRHNRPVREGPSPSQRGAGAEDLTTDWPLCRVHGEPGGSPECPRVSARPRNQPHVCLQKWCCELLTTFSDPSGADQKQTAEKGEEEGVREQQRRRDGREQSERGALARGRRELQKLDQERVKRGRPPRPLPRTAPPQHPARRHASPACAPGSWQPAGHAALPAGGVAHPCSAGPREAVHTPEGRHRTAGPVRVRSRLPLKTRP